MTEKATLQRRVKRLTASLKDRAAISVEGLDDILKLLARAHALLEDDHPRFAREIAEVLWPVDSTLAPSTDGEKK